MGLPRQWRRVSIWINYALCQRIPCTESFKKNEFFLEIAGLAYELLLWMLCLFCVFAVRAVLFLATCCFCHVWLLALVFQKERARR